MALFTPNCGKKAACQVLVSANFWYDIVFYKNNYTPTDGDAENCSNYTAADFTDQATGVAVVAQVITWGAAAVVTNMGQDTGTTITVTKSGATGNTIYGCIIRDNTGKLRGVNPFPSPVDMNTDGNKVTINPLVLMQRMT